MNRAMLLILELLKLLLCIVLVITKYGNHLWLVSSHNSLIFKLVAEWTIAHQKLCYMYVSVVTYLKSYVCGHYYNRKPPEWLLTEN